jgi:hypothetical protein
VKVTVVAFVAAILAMCGVVAVADQSPSPAFQAAAEACVNSYGAAVEKAQDGKDVPAAQSAAIRDACDKAGALALAEQPAELADAMQAYAFATTAAYNVAGDLKDACAEFSKSAAVATTILKTPDTDPDLTDFASQVLDKYTATCTTEKQS